VIPYIKSVTAPATAAKMPTVPYTWNSTHIDIMLENAADDLGVRTKQITGFFQALEVDGVGEGNVKKLVAAGFDRICKITQMTEADFLSVNGFQEKSAKKFVASIRERIAEASLATLMSASNIFGRGFGQRKMELILRNYPRVLDMGERDPVKVAQIEGMARKTAEEFVSHIPAFVAFLEECHLEHKLGTGVGTGVAPAGPGVPVGVGGPEVVEVDTTHPLFGKTVVMTGFRSKVLEERLKAVGAKNGSSVSRTTLAVLVKDRASSSGKVKDAEKLGVPIYTEEEFTARYFP
jgi:NAD-dependent DNA ligase